eukprot:GFUD01038434.1.p1 GENE.GFUD01038434.1~~GFUD01038434.1.p1  ORF type:complete len:680 (-),score=179.14 GFUD01038434.1:51-2090(-)
MILYLCSLSVFFSFGLSQEVLVDEMLVDEVLVDVEGLLVDADNVPLYPADHTLNLYSEPSEECEAKRVLCGLQPDEKELLVNLHNTNRRRIGAATNREESMKELAWNEELAKTAQMWGDQCTLGHDKLRGLLWQGARLDVGQYVYFGYSWVQDNAEEIVDLVEETNEDLVEEIIDEVGIDDGSDDELLEDAPEDSDLSRDVLPDMIIRAVDNWFAETSQEGRDYISIESLAYPVSDGSYCPQLKYCNTSAIGCGLTAYQEAEYPGWLYTLIVCNYAVVQPEELPTPSSTPSPTPAPDVEDIVEVETGDSTAVDVSIENVEQVHITDETEVPIFDDEDTSEVQAVDPVEVDTTDDTELIVEGIPADSEESDESIVLVDTTDGSVDDELVPILHEDTLEVQVDTVVLVDTTDGPVVDVDDGDVEQVPILDDDEDTYSVQADDTTDGPVVDVEQVPILDETEDISEVQVNEPDVVEEDGSVVDDDTAGRDINEGVPQVTVEDGDNEVDTGDITAADVSIGNVEQVPVTDETEVPIFEDQDAYEVQAVDPVEVDTTENTDVVDELIVEGIPTDSDESIVLVDTTDGSVVDVEKVPILDEDTSEVKAVEQVPVLDETEDISEVQANEPDVVKDDGSVVDEDTDSRDTNEGATLVTVEDADNEVLHMLRRIMQLLDGNEDEKVYT